MGYEPKLGHQPSKAAKKRVREAFDPAMLKAICESDELGFINYGDFVDLGKNGFYYYRDNGSDILAVAHLDTVQHNRTCSVVDTAAGMLACSGALDDRLGAYVILELLPKLGVTCDILLTVGEESCQSTAMDFETEKEYNWVIEFDRGGTDVVMYQYETADYADLLKECGARIGVGSYSDIAELEHLGVACFNWGVGYEDYHSARSHAWLDDTFRQVARFVKFYHLFHDIALPHYWEPPKKGWPYSDDDEDDSEAWREYKSRGDDDYAPIHELSARYIDSLIEGDR